MREGKSVYGGGRRTTYGRSAESAVCEIIPSASSRMTNHTVVNPRQQSHALPVRLFCVINTTLLLLPFMLFNLAFLSSIFDSQFFVFSLVLGGRPLKHLPGSIRDSRAFQHHPGDPLSDDCPIPLRYQGALLAPWSLGVYHRPTAHPANYHQHVFVTPGRPVLVRLVVHSLAFMILYWSGHHLISNRTDVRGGLYIPSDIR